MNEKYIKEMRVAENNTLENWLLGEFDCYSDEDGEVWGKRGTIYGGNYTS